MQVKAENFTLLNNIIGRAQKILIVLPDNPSLDAAAGGLFLQENFASLGKKVSLIAQGNIPVELKDFSGKFLSKLPTKKLVVSFDWKKNAVDKVSYNLDGDSFNFIIAPLNKKINIEDVELSYQGEDSDLIITIGIESQTEIEGLEELVSEERTVININKSSKNDSFGSLNFSNPTADSLSAMIANIFENAQVAVVTESCDTLLQGIRSATENFQKVTDASTFEAAAFCTRSKEGKRRSSNKEAEVPAEWLAPKAFKSKESPN